MIAAAALQAAMRAALAGDAAVTGLLGGPAIHDRVPDQAPFPYITFGPSATQDWSTGHDDGTDEYVTLDIWSDKAGRKQALQIAGAVREALAGALPQLAGHRIVLLRFAGMDAAAVPAMRGFRVTLRYSALTEPA